MSGGLQVRRFLASFVTTEAVPSACAKVGGTALFLVRFEYFTEPLPHIIAQLIRGNLAPLRRGFVLRVMVPPAVVFVTADFAPFEFRLFVSDK